MPEPDFDQIAHAIKWSIPDDKGDIEFIVEQLRQVWNARGAADIATTDLERFTAMLQRAGVPFKQQDVASNTEADDPSLRLPAHILVSIAQPEKYEEHPKVGGYVNSYGEFHFARESGALLGCSFWE